MRNAVAHALLSIDAVGFAKGEPIQFKSGILSPVYVDNRKLPSHPKEWKTVIDGFVSIVKGKQLAFDVIAGIATGGIPHSAVLGYELQKPTAYVRKEIKGHGTGKRTEGESVKGKTVLLVEDLVTTGGSSLSGVEALRSEGAVVHDCLVIVSYAFPESQKGFARANVNLHPLVTFKEILEVAFELKKCTKAQADAVASWVKDPWKWTKEHTLRT